MLTNVFKENENIITNLTDNDKHGQIPADLHTSTLKNTQKKKNIVKTVARLKSNKMKTKPNNYRAFKVKRTVYTNTQKNFIVASNNLKKSYEKIKLAQMDLSSDQNDFQFEELDITVKNIIEKVFGIKFPNTPLKKQCKQFVSNHVPKPLSVDINDTSGYYKLDLVIKEACEDVWKRILDVSVINEKYRFWLQNVIEPNEFCKYDVREYLTQNMFHEKDTIERSQHKLNEFNDYTQIKLMNIINEVIEILKHKQRITEHDSSAIENKNIDQCKESEETLKKNFKTIIEERKRAITMKIKTLEMENEKLRKNEFDYSRQAKTLLKKLAFRNKNLENIKECIASLSREKNDLIFMVEKTEIENDSVQTIQHNIEVEQEKNKHLRDFIAKKYDK